MGTKFVYDFNEGNRDMKDLLGGKGANLAEMTNMGLPVPPGFTISTEVCGAFSSSGTLPPAVVDEISGAVEWFATPLIRVPREDLQRLASVNDRALDRLREAAGNGHVRADSKHSINIMAACELPFS